MATRLASAAARVHVAEQDFITSAAVIAGIVEIGLYPERIDLDHLRGEYVKLREARDEYEAAARQRSTNPPDIQVGDTIIGTRGGTCTVIREK